MQKILKTRSFKHANGDIEIVEVLYVGNPKYADGVKFNMAYLQFNPEAGSHFRLFGIDNSHGRPHVHRRDDSEEMDCDWKTALKIFDDMIFEQIRKEGRSL